MPTQINVGPNGTTLTDMARAGSIPRTRALGLIAVPRVGMPIPEALQPLPEVTVTARFDWKFWLLLTGAALVLFKLVNPRAKILPF